MALVSPFCDYGNYNSFKGSGEEEWIIMFQLSTGQLRWRQDRYVLE